MRAAKRLFFLNSHQSVRRKLHTAFAVFAQPQMTLKSSSHRSSTDADIAVVAVRALTWNSALPVGLIRVTVSKGWVTLEGDVEWQYQKREAEKAVRPLWGVLVAGTRLYADH